MNKMSQQIVWPCWNPCEATEMEHLRRYILTDWAGAHPINSPWGLSTLKVRKLRKFRCVKIFCHPIHCPLEDGQTGCFLNKKNFVLALIVSATKTCAVLFVSTGLAGWWVVCKTNVLWVKVMSRDLDDQLPFVFFATKNLSHLAQVQLFIVVVTDFPSQRKFHICRILQTQRFVPLYW